MNRAARFIRRLRIVRHAHEQLTEFFFLKSVEGRVKVSRKLCRHFFEDFGLFFGAREILDRFIFGDRADLGRRNPEAIPRLDDMRVRDLAVVAPDRRPYPRRAQVGVGNIPKGVPGNDRVDSTHAAFSVDTNRTERDAVYDNRPTFDRDFGGKIFTRALVGFEGFGFHGSSLSDCFHLVPRIGFNDSRSDNVGVIAFATGNGGIRRFVRPLISSLLACRLIQVSHLVAIGERITTFVESRLCFVRTLGHKVRHFRLRENGTALA